jgi:hypothetical protein
LAYGVFPGGETEDPVSRYYDNYVPIYEAHDYKQLLFLTNITNPTLIMKPGPLFMTELTSLSWVLALGAIALVAAAVVRRRSVSMPLVATGIWALLQLINWYLPLLAIVPLALFHRGGLGRLLLITTLVVLVVLLIEYSYRFITHYGESTRLIELVSSLAGLPEITILPLLAYLVLSISTASIINSAATMIRLRL